jgi:hypothetical protein
LEELAAGHEATTVANEHLDQLPFGWRQAGLAVWGRDAPTGEIDREVGRSDDRFLIERNHTPEHRTHACQELPDPERLDDVVIRSSVEGSDLVGFALARTIRLSVLWSTVVGDE